MLLSPDHCLSTVENCEVMDRILRSAGKLRSSFCSIVWLRDVFIQPDRSKKERDLRRSLVVQLKEKRSRVKDGLSKGIRLFKRLFPILLMNS